MDRQVAQELANFLTAKLPGVALPVVKDVASNPLPVGFVGLRTERANRVVVRLSPPPNIGGRVAKLDDGFEVGSSLDPQLAWLSSDPVGGYVSPGEWAFAAIAKLTGRAEEGPE
jgi:hypothetical protein